MLDIEGKFFAAGAQDYYRIRRLVYQACHYWISRLESSLKDAKDIPFNKLYYYNAIFDSFKFPLKAARFIEMLEHIKLLFPVTAPQEQEKLYFTVMQTVASFHEESAKIQSMNDNKKLKRYHSCVRNFRNWSAHNLMNPKLSASKFALLFCITLRTYFNWSSDNDLDNALFEYESKYAFCPDSRLNINKDNLEESLLSIWESVHQKLNTRYYSDLEEAIRELGKTDYCDDMKDYMTDFLFIPLWCPIKLLLTAEKQSGYFNEPSQVLIQVDSRSINLMCEKTKTPNERSSDVCFKRFCYQWVVEIPKLLSKVKSKNAQNLK